MIPGAAAERWRRGDEELPFPAGFSLRMDRGLRRPRPDRLVGGAPWRVLRLSPKGTEVLDRLTAGDPIPLSLPAQRLARRLVDAGMAHPRPSRLSAGALDASDVTVVIPVRDRPAGLGDTLAHLGAVGGVLVIDDASVDAEATQRQVAAAAPLSTAAVDAGKPGSRVSTVRLVRRQIRGGPAAARNTGWPQVSTQLVAFVDADCRPGSGWLAPLVAHFADATVAAVAPRILASPVPAAPGWLVEYERWRSPLDLGPAEGPVKPGGRVAYVPTAALLVRRTALEQLGGFDESMPVGEDVDLIWRLIAADWRVRYEPASTVAHPIRPTVTAALRQRFDYGRSAAPLAARHGDAVAPLKLSASTGSAWLLAGSGHPVVGAAVAVGTTLAWPLRERRPPLPAPELLRLAARGHATGGLALASAIRRVWWPLAVPLARWPRLRVGLVTAGAIPSLVDWVKLRPKLDPFRWTLLDLAQDLAYGAGVWSGAVRARSAAAVSPRWRSRTNRHRAGGRRWDSAVGNTAGFRKGIAWLQATPPPHLTRPGTRH